jgi:RNA polymerase sigma-70 factor (ECF subfamily)
VDEQRLDRSADIDIALAAQAGDAEAWEELVSRYYAPLLRYLTAQTGDPEAAADLAQQTFLVTWQRLDRFTPDRPFVAWLYRVARYELLPWRRRQQAQRQESVEALEEANGHAFSGSSGSAEREAVEERDAIRRALDALSPVLREALLLHELHGLSARQIAAVLEISEAAAEQRISRAAVAFRRHYTLSLSESDAQGGG